MKAPTEEFLRFYQDVLQDPEFIRAFNEKAGTSIEVGKPPASEEENQKFTAYIKNFYERSLQLSSTQFIN